MAIKRNIPLVIIIIVGFSLIITIPIFTLSINLSDYDTYEDSLSIMHFPSNASEIQSLNVYSEIGDVVINYFEPGPNLPHAAILEVNFMMSGKTLSNKDYSDYFIIVNETQASQFNFKMNFRTDIDKIKAMSLINQIDIIVILRADIVFDVNISTVEGNVDVSVPYMISIRNLKVNTSKGDLFYDFNNCIFKGNVSGKTEEGDLRLINNDVKCVRNVIWNLTVQNGDFDLEIDQNKEIGANITATMVIPEGRLKLNYFDDSGEVGAIFIFPLFSLPVIPPPHSGFETDVFNVGVGIFGHLYKTIGFPAISNFNFKFNLTNEDYDLNIFNN
jgi:hypothetical protein